MSGMDGAEPLHFLLLVTSLLGQLAVALANVAQRGFDCSAISQKACLLYPYGRRLMFLAILITPQSLCD